MSDRVQKVLLPLVALAALVAIWEAALHVFRIPSFVLPQPEAVLVALKRGYVDGLMWKHLWFTMQSLAWGYLLGCSAALLAGAVFAESKLIERLFYPYVIALQSMPKVALAPLIIVWFGFGIESKIVMVALICFFPVFINTAVGLRQTPAPLLDLMRAFSASRLHVLLRIKLPAAAGHIFAGLQIAVVLGLIGAVVAEFVSSTRGLGHLISASAVNLDTSVMFACLLSLSAIGVTGTQLIRVLHAKIVFWDKPPGTETTVAE